MSKELKIKTLLKVGQKNQEKYIIFNTLNIWQKHLAPFKYQVILGLVLKFLSNISSNILVPIMLGLIINHIASNPYNFDRKYVYIRISLVCLLLIFSIIFDYLWNVTCGKYLAKSKSNLEQYVFSELLNKKYSFHSSKLGGSMVSQYNRFLIAYQYFHDTVFRELYSVLINFGASMIVTFFYSKIIGLTMLIWSITYVYVILKISSRKFQTKKNTARNLSKTTGYINDVFSNILTIKIFARENFEKNNFKKYSDNKLNSSISGWVWSAKTTAVIGSLMAILNLLVLILAVESVNKQLINIGTLVLIQAFTVRISMQLWQLGNIVRDLDKSFVDSGELTEILINQPSILEATPKRVKIERGQIDINNISFEYPDEHSIPAFFKKLSLHINAGEKIGIVGPSGSGKTTLIKLILRLAEVTSGDVLIDNQNVKDIPHKQLRDTIAFVPQEPILFHRTIKENIVYANPGASQSEIESAIKKSRANIFINRLPNGIDTLVGERGFKLSAGQRQRIAIARAFLRPTPILILDEATSAIDSESETLIQKSLNQLTKSRTTIIIAHRFSTIKKMDRIIFMSYGKIIETGTHDELIKNDGPYARLWKMQSSDIINQEDFTK